MQSCDAMHAPPPLHMLCAGADPVLTCGPGALYPLHGGRPEARPAQDHVCILQAQPHQGYQGEAGAAAPAAQRCSLALDLATRPPALCGSALAPGPWLWHGPAPRAAAARLGLSALKPALPWAQDLWCHKPLSTRLDNCCNDSGARWGGYPETPCKPLPSLTLPPPFCHPA